jgi:hypothetical protein
VPDTTWLEVAVKQRLEAGGRGPLEATLSQGHALSYRGVVSVGAKENDVPVAPKYPATAQLPLSLEEFYRGFTFHGPRLQGIVSIEAVGEDGVVGLVKGCRPADWIKDPKRSEWTVDPLIVDASFQLAGYWAWVKHQRAGFPSGWGGCAARSFRRGADSLHGVLRRRRGRPLHRHRCGRTSARSSPG